MENLFSAIELYKIWEDLKSPNVPCVTLYTNTWATRPLYTIKIRNPKIRELIETLIKMDCANFLREQNLIIKEKNIDVETKDTRPYEAQAMMKFKELSNQLFIKETAKRLSDTLKLKL